MTNKNSEQSAQATMETENKSIQQLEQDMAELRQLVSQLQTERDSARQAVQLLIQLQEAMQFANLQVTAQMELRTMLEAILKLLYRLTGALTAQIYLLEDDKLEFGAFLREGVPQDHPLSEPRPQGLTNTVARSGQRLIINDVATHALYVDAAPSYRANARSLIGIPLLIGRQTVGVMNVGFAQAGFITDSIVGQLELFAMQSAIAIENIRLYKESQESRERDRKYYEELNRTKDLVMDMVSHDLKNPIGNIKGYVTLLRRHGRTDTDMGKDALHQIEEGANLMLALVTDLLDLAKLETGLALKRELTEINALVKNTVAQQMLAAQQKNTVVHLDFDPPQIELWIDAKRIRQVLANLVSNAIKYTPAEGVVLVSTRRKGGYAIIRVADSGFGIPTEELPFVFEKFHRVKSREHADIDGTGLGLAIVKTIVEQHRGDISVESKLGKGSIFIVKLPVPPPNTDHEETQEIILPPDMK